MDIQIEQLKRNNLLIFPQTTAEAVLVKLGNTVVRLDEILIPNMPLEININGTLYLEYNGLNEQLLNLINGDNINLISSENGVIIQALDTTYTAGIGLELKDNEFNLISSTSDIIGGIKTGYISSERNYKVELDSESNAFVKVPWILYLNFNSETPGLVPNPSENEYKNRYLNESGEWKEVSINGNTIKIDNTIFTGYSSTELDTKFKDVTDYIDNSILSLIDGTSDLFLKADGSIDSNVYIKIEDSNYSTAYCRFISVNNKEYGFFSWIPSDTFSIYSPTSLGNVNQYLIGGEKTPLWKNIDPCDSIITRTKNTILAAPKDKDGIAEFRKLSIEDIPDLSGLYLTSISWNDIKDKPVLSVDTWRDIYCDNESIGSNSLTLKPGSNIVLNNSNGTVTITAIDTTYGLASTTLSGLMSSDDKVKLDNIATSVVNFESELKSGIKIGTISINDVNTDLYCMWQLNTKDYSGYVTAPGENNKNKVWKTDDNGNPGWRDDLNANYTLSQLEGISTITITGESPLNLTSSKEGTEVTITGSINNATSTEAGILKLYQANDCNSYTLDDGAATPAAVKKAISTFVKVEQKLTSGTLIGTIEINGKSTNLYCEKVVPVEITDFFDEDSSNKCLSQKGGNTLYNLIESNYDTLLDKIKTNSSDIDNLYDIINNLEIPDYSDEFNNLQNQINNFEDVSVTDVEYHYKPENATKRISDSSHDLTQGRIYLIDTIYVDDAGHVISVSGLDSSNYAKTSDLENYYSKFEVDELINNIDFSNYYTKNEVENLINNIDTSVDLTDYYTKLQVNSLIDNINTSVDLTGYATEEWVINNYLPLTGGTVNGTISASAFYQDSDKNLKNNIQFIQDSILNKIYNINEVTFTWKNTGKTAYGYIAQDVLLISEDLVRIADDGHLVLDYNSVLVIQVAALKLKIENLEERIKILEKF